MRVALGFLFTLAWAVYLGGALAMELVWRPVQRDIPPSQIGAMCRWMGRRYRWLGLGALGLAAVTWLAWRGLGGTVLLASRPAAAVPPAASGWPVAAMVACWGCLAALVLAMGVLLHPRSHARWRAGAHAADAAAARRRKVRALRTMDVLLRVELAVALSTTALVVLPSGPRIGWAA
ncbi:MAG TPA: hypothetical protein VIH95_05945 [Acidimicrobiales bacterium]|jgi:hypothetical protein